ncbi:hypothetical protein KKA00_08005 [bacterium]|nr:hypothetical protein [bacterium]MBU1652149.1 hypothetical protein [bacterium]
MPIITDLRAAPRLNQVYSRMGFKPAKADIPESMLAMVDEAIQLGKALAEPKACYQYFPIMRTEPNMIEIEGQFVIQSAKVYDWMAGCQGLYIGAVTLGPELDQTVAEMMADNYVTKGFLVNAYGAQAAEAAMVELNHIITQETETNGFATSKRYSPGYGDWAISAQKDVLQAINAAQIGISLTDNYLMIPEKSVSAIIGMRPQR